MTADNPLKASAFRLILGEAQDGRRNMATDEALLTLAQEAAFQPVIRLYGFAPPTLSVGRFQETARLIDFDALHADGVTFVRRPSGGQAVLHDGEMTYAVVLCERHLTRFSKREVYRFLSPLLVTGLLSLGVRSAALSAGARGDASHPDCFASTSEYEIDSGDGRKLIGSAQMVTRGAVLQHGSIPLNETNRKISRYLKGTSGGGHAPSNASEQGARVVSVEEAVRRFGLALSEAVPTVPSRLNTREETLTERLFREKYSTDEWNRKH